MIQTELFFYGIGCNLFKCYLSVLEYSNVNLSHVFKKVSHYYLRITIENVKIFIIFCMWKIVAIVLCAEFYVINQFYDIFM